MRPRVLRLLLLAAVLLPRAGAAAQLRPATLSVSVTVIRPVEIDVARAAPTAAAARVGSERLVFTDDAPPSVVVELRGEALLRLASERRPDPARSPAGPSPEGGGPEGISPRPCRHGSTIRGCS